MRRPAGTDIKYFCNRAGTAVASSWLPNVLIFKLSRTGQAHTQNRTENLSGGLSHPTKYNRTGRPIFDNPRCQPSHN
ncbi:hypothetical protein CROQUDRAFT_89259 [Cronartium quercuum f. sp. fusiforme G11]|uniref:Uncharacterized protein n=1 Tax=Cronartium quercuum f. sp. fusiforme G11 TaxID=708437 RepID=A0A9P6NSB9_9BASI|nr:hypothetical protein CROQUDRAFT_89259 [Cronartium quercuum f. sp. fusiforme G11]